MITNSPPKASILSLIDAIPYSHPLQFHICFNNILPRKYVSLPKKLFYSQRCEVLARRGVDHEYYFLSLDV